MTDFWNASCGLPLTNEHAIDTELVSNVIVRLHCGKAPDIVGLTAEHLLNSHLSLFVILCKLFKLIISHKYVPAGFRSSYIVPVPKVKECRSRSITYDDFRGIAISPIICKVFEHRIIHKFYKINVLPVVVLSLVLRIILGVEMQFIRPVKL